MLTLRRAERTDIPRMADVHVRSWAAGYEGKIPPELAAFNTLEARRKRWRQYLADAANTVFVLVREEELLGFAAGGPESEGDAGTAEVLGLFIAPDAWGQGHGRRLLRILTDELLRQGFRRGCLWVLVGNTPARNLYEREGWVAVGAPETDVRGVTRVRYSVDWTVNPPIPSPPESGNG
ncbi:MAG: GNAT family N-acetyltransferase [Myxococcaceae bacterium]|nr:GNAT family N-acetyltransferase [Myxococcaceae bacterium]